MIGEFIIGGRVVRCDFLYGTCLAIPLDFTGPQPNHFGAEPAKAEPMRVGSFVGDTKQGGSCNVPIFRLNPHCNGTHTECSGHITNNALPVNDVVPPWPIPAWLVTVSPEAYGQAPCKDSYCPSLREGDLLITAAALMAPLSSVQPPWLEAVAIRTNPNSDEKRSRTYEGTNPPPFFSIEAVEFLNSLNVEHLLVDIPSVDRMHDEGMLTVHHSFWGIPKGAPETVSGKWSRTITEMIYVPDELPDGPYLLTIEIPAFSTDCAPSRPWLFPVEFV